MSRVLISFLGTGRIKRGSSSREYEGTKYRIDDKEYECSFVSVALRKHLKIDKMILIGTPHSMWEEVYREYADPLNDEIWTELGTACEGNDFSSDLDIPYKNEVEQAMGNGSKVVLVKYGLNTEEIRENSEIILALESSLNRGDELFVDITHSFRSLPLFVMNLLIYLRDVSLKRIKISGIYYGMLEAAYQLSYAPIVNLSEVLNVNSWISGAYSFMEFGNADKIAELVKEFNENLSRDLSTFSEVKNLNHLSELECQSQKLGNMLKTSSQLPTMAKLVINPVVNDFAKRLIVDGNNEYKHSVFQGKLARWQFNNKNYLAAYISLTEAIVTYLAEDYKNKTGLDVDVFAKDERDDIKDKIKAAGDTSIAEGWKRLYRDVSYKRNALAHNLRRDNNRSNDVVKVFIEDLRKNLGEFDKLCKNNNAN